MLPNLPDTRDGSHTIDFVDSHVILCGGGGRDYYYEYDYSGVILLIIVIMNVMMDMMIILITSISALGKINIFRYSKSCLALTSNLAWTPISFPL